MYVNTQWNARHNWLQMSSQTSSKSMQIFEASLSLSMMVKNPKRERQRNLYGVFYSYNFYALVTCLYRFPINVGAVPIGEKQIEIFM